MESTNNNKSCCFKSVYYDNDKTIVSLSHTRKGKFYLRSNNGVRIATNTLIYVLSKLSLDTLSRCGEKEIEDQVKLDIIYEWQKRTNLALKRKKITRLERQNLTSNLADKIKVDPFIMYDCSLAGFLHIADKVVAVTFGDFSSQIVYKNKQKKNTPPNKHYICDPNLYNYININVFDANNIKTMDFSHNKNSVLCCNFPNDSRRYFDERSSSN